MHLEEHILETFILVNEKWYRNSWKQFDRLKNIDQKYCCSSCCDISANKYGFKCKKSLRFWENNGWINEIQINKWKGVVSGFRCKLINL